MCVLAVIIKSPMNSYVFWRWWSNTLKNHMDSHGFEHDARDTYEIECFLIRNNLFSYKDAYRASKKSLDFFYFPKLRNWPKSSPRKGKTSKNNIENTSAAPLKTPLKKSKKCVHKHPWYQTLCIHKENHHNRSKPLFFIGITTLPEPYFHRDGWGSG